MDYIIDGNNLAGQIGLLNQENFDKIIEEKIKRFFSQKKIQIFLIFDSSDPMGDAYQAGNLKTIYTPKDNYYASADDKIIEVAGKLLPQKEMVLITKDQELKNKVLKLAENKRCLHKITIKTPKSFYNQISLKEKVETDKTGLTETDKNKLNQELLKAFKQNKK